MLIRIPIAVTSECEFCVEHSSDDNVFTTAKDLVAEFKEDDYDNELDVSLIVITLDVDVFSKRKAIVDSIEVENVFTSCEVEDAINGNDDLDKLVLFYEEKDDCEDVEDQEDE